MKNFKTKCYVLLGIFAIFNGAVAQESKISEAKIISISNPLQSHGIQVGDVLSRKIVLEVKAPYQLSQQTLPMKGTRTNDVELSQISITQTASQEAIRYSIDLRYQVFSAVFVPSVLQLPAEKFALTGGAQALSVNLPAWKFWFSPLAPKGMTKARENMHMQFKPTLIDLKPYANKVLVFSGMLIVGLLGLVYINADKRWLPFMNGAFAKAHRKLKKLPRNEDGEKQALSHMHLAFNQLHGGNLFVNELNEFLSKHPAFVKFAKEIEAFFEQSNQSLFAQKTQNSEQLMADLMVLSRRLRDCERGV
ncbi:hypothetical protein [Methylotenera sp. L2L1]|uniref:hypothetical protein n=1 Tax=Methylotenera sp. L2L1 TaxID=1502770 RepID=UPI00055E7306|nr:hypothetical protein [Methylotenera sp. L2L1]